jgi:hypothetical protein
MLDRNALLSKNPELFPLARRMPMATARISSYRPGLVDLVAGQISREIFVNDEIYQEELERVFARAWLFVGHESQIPNSGDFFVSSSPRCSRKGGALGSQVAHTVPL